MTGTKFKMKLIFMFQYYGSETKCLKKTNRKLTKDNLTKFDENIIDT